MAIEDVEPRLLAMAQDYDPLKSDTVLRSRDYRELNDPFYGAYSQTNRMRAYCQVIVDGLDITEKLDPHLISVRIQDGNHYECELEIDDRDGRLPLPPVLATLEVRLGWAREQMYRMYEGLIQSIEHGFGRKQGGRRMWIKATGWNMIGTRIKQPMDDNLGAGAPPGQRDGQMHPLTTWINQIAQRGGGIAQVNPFFAQYRRDHWGMTGASPLHQITQLGQQFGAMVQWSSGNRVNFMVPAQNGLSCRAVWRDNLIGWRVFPFVERFAWRGPQAAFFDPRTGAWIRRMVDAVGNIVGPGAQATAQGGAPGPAASSNDANTTNEGQRRAIQTGHGRIVINGEPAARFDSLVSLEGARPGVDGHYLIWVAEHIYSRQGYVTWLDVTTYNEAQGAANVFNAWPLPRPNPNMPGAAAPPPLIISAPRTEEEIAARDARDREALDRLTRQVEAERIAAEAAAEEAFIRDRANLNVIPGRSPFGPGGVFGRAVTELDRRAYRRWYEQRGLAIPPQWQE